MGERRMTDYEWYMENVNHDDPDGGSDFPYEIPCPECDGYLFRADEGWCFKPGNDELQCSECEKDFIIEIKARLVYEVSMPERKKKDLVNRAGFRRKADGSLGDWYNETKWEEGDNTDE